MINCHGLVKQSAKHLTRRFFPLEYQVWLSLYNAFT